MRRLTIACSIWGAMGCASAPDLILPSGHGARPITVTALLDQNPLAAGENIRAVALGQTDALSYHFVQIREQERPHVHAAHDLAVTLLRGTGTLYIDGTATDMRSGDVAVVTRGTPHYFVNRGCRPAAALVTFGPPYDGKDQVPIE